MCELEKLTPNMSTVTNSNQFVCIQQAALKQWQVNFPKPLPKQAGEIASSFTDFYK
jgi:hypothetical protein